MKTNILFGGFLILAVACNFLAIPNQAVSAKALAGPFTNCVTQTQIPATECDALVALYTATDGANWRNHTDWLLTDTPCSWFGITCDGGNHVQGLSLGKNKLSGSIPPELSNLANLTTLDLSANTLSAIPPELGSLTNLTTLDLGYIALSAIPPELGSLTNLTTLDLSGNVLSAIPPELGSLTNLTTLDLSGNVLSAIPSELGSLTNLTTLDLSGNLLSAIPPELGSLTNLTGLYLGHNTLIGAIPPELGSLDNLVTLILDHNTLSGAIPPQLGSLTNLTGLYLGNNTLSGAIPPELGSLTNLVTLVLDHNSLSGAIPPELGSLDKLDYLDLNHNTLSAIPPELGNLTTIRYLGLDYNVLSGPIPPELGNLDKLFYLNFRGNMLSGPIPPELGNLANLEELHLAGNALDGPIPSELGSLAQLAYLDLSANALSGPIPTELGSLTNLVTLDLSGNALSGPIPTELGSLTILATLDLSGNALSGPIPAELGSSTILVTLDLSGNALSGPIPPELGNPTNIYSLRLNDNRLSGEFPASITNLTVLSTLTFDCELTSSNPDVIAFINARIPGWQNGTCPNLVAPSEGATLDNGRLDRLDDIVWDFDWSDVPGATKYQLYVNHTGAPSPTINNTNISNSAYHYLKLNSTITQANRYNWTWKTRAYINGQWGAWSRLQTFSLESPDTDAPQTLSKNGGLNTYPSISRVPTGWKAVNFLSTDGKTTITKQEGAASVRIIGAAGKTKMLSQTLNVGGPAGDLLIFSYWVKGSAVPAGGVCQGQVLFYSGATLKGTKTLKCPSTATYSFRKMKLNIVAPAVYTKVVITFTYSKPSGTAWFDAVSLIR